MYRFVFLWGLIGILLVSGCSQEQDSPEVAQDSPEVDSVEYKKQALTLRKYAQNFSQRAENIFQNMPIEVGFGNNQPKRIYNSVIEEFPEWTVVSKKPQKAELLLMREWVHGELFFTAAPGNPFEIWVTIKSCRKNNGPSIKVRRIASYSQGKNVSWKRNILTDLSESEAPRCVDYATSNVEN